MTLLFGCKENRIFNKGKVKEGVVTYHIDFPNFEHKEDYEAFLPEELTFVFKDENQISIILSLGMGMMKVVRILNYEKKEAISLFMAFGGINFGCVETLPEIKDFNQTLPKYSMEKTKEQKEIAGIKCTKAIIHDETNDSTFQVYYANDILTTYWTTPYNITNNLLMEYYIAVNGVNLKLTAVKVEIEPVDTSLFSVQGNFRWLKKVDFDRMIKERLPINPAPAEDETGEISAEDL